MGSHKRKNPDVVVKPVESERNELHDQKQAKPKGSFKGRSARAVSRTLKNVLKKNSNPPLRPDSTASGLPPIDDTDLDPTDFDAHVARYEYYIQQGHPRAAFEMKLRNIGKAKEMRREISSQFEGMDWNTIQRLENLKIIKAKLIEQNDPCRELENIEAIIAAYESRELTFGDSTTYWCRGENLGETKGIDWEMFKRLNTKENRHGCGFWVEGIFPGPSCSSKVRRYESENRDPKDEFSSVPVITQYIRLDRRIFPTGTTEFPPEFHTRFIDDTGADHVSIYESDLRLIMGDQANHEEAPWDHLMGYNTVQVGDGSFVVEKVVAVELNILGTDRHGDPVFLKDEWAPAPCMIVEADESQAIFAGGLRTGGPFLRSCFYVGSVPQIPPKTYVCTIKRGIRAPDIPEDKVPRGPPFLVPMQGVTWSFDELKGKWVSAPDPGTEGRKPTDIIKAKQPRTQ